MFAFERLNIEFKAAVIQREHLQGLPTALKPLALNRLSLTEGACRCWWRLASSDAITPKTSHVSDVVRAPGSLVVPFQGKDGSPFRSGHTTLLTVSGLKKSRWPTIQSPYWRSVKAKVSIKKRNSSVLNSDSTRERTQETCSLSMWIFYWRRHETWELGRQGLNGVWCIGADTTASTYSSEFMLANAGCVCHLQCSGNPSPFSIFLSQCLWPLPITHWYDWGWYWFVSIVLC